MSRSWYRMRAAAKDGKPASAEIEIYDEVGFWGIRAADFIRDLRAMGEVDAITLNINSPGGEVFDGLAIYNVLNRHPAQVTARIDGIAASIASVIAMAGDEVVMPDNAMMMIHDPTGLVIGTAEDMRDLAETLDKVKGSLVAAYRNKTGLEEDEIGALMAAETWLTASEAKAKGFCDRIAKPVKVAASANKIARYSKNLPAALAAAVPPAAPVQSLEQEQSMSDPKNQAGAPSAETIDVEKLKAEARAAAVAEQQAYAAEVRDLCALAGLPHKAGELIASAKPVAEVRAELIKAKAEADAAAPVQAFHNGTTAPPPAAPDHTAIYASRARAMGQR